MFDQWKIISEHKSLISICLCMVFIINTGCQSNQQKSLSLHKDNIGDAASQSQIQEVGPKNSDQSKKSHDIDKALEGIGEFITETANSVSYIPIAGAAVAVICIDYESWRTLCEAF